MNGAATVTLVDLLQDRLDDTVRETAALKQELGVQTEILWYAWRGSFFELAWSLTASPF